ncbi:MAG: urate hydroxylase PuuD, partial [Alphaproteobacteria bacterium]|nr:urate hydroxylase PuuD [Alphaproteobacteria bacterium]
IPVNGKGSQPGNQRILNMWYLNFVQVPTMPKIPDEMKPAIGKHIAPAVLFWFRWSAASTVLWGLLLAIMQGTFGDWFAIGLTDGSSTSAFIGIGMWLGLIMAFNVWFVIWPSQKVALGIVDAPADRKPQAARRALLFSRTNTMLSIPMLYGMLAAQNPPF